MYIFYIYSYTVEMEVLDIDCHPLLTRNFEKKPKDEVRKVAGL